MRLNLGSHDKRIENYVNVDALNLPNVDINHDLTKFPYPFENDSIDEILMVEVLEHISFKDTVKVLKECWRILKEDGILKIQVPDCGEMMFLYENGQICDCVEHKPKNDSEGYGKLNCPKCEGYGRVHPNRWLYSFLGAQKHEYDTHKNIFDKKSMKNYLLNAGFQEEDIEIKSDKRKWKIIAIAKK